MQPDRWQQIDDLFNQALDLNPAERAAFLEKACAGDDELRKEIESLLGAHQDAGTFITTSASVMLADDARLQLPETIGPYKIISELGRGGMAEVYLAEDNRLRRKMVLKILPDFSSQDPEMVLRFKREAQAASTLNHPNIITVYDLGETEGVYYIATEYVEGKTLRDLAAQGPLPLLDAVDIALQIATALDIAHQSGIIHRDIKPENVMVRQDGLVKVLDFGLAKPVATSQRLQSETTARVTTKPWTVMGTAPYMSPEQARGQELDNKTDLFSLGIVLYEISTGKRPFDGPTSSDIIASILVTEPPPASEFCAGAPDELDGILAKALAKDKSSRYQTAAEFASDLEQLKVALEHKADRDVTVALTRNSGEMLRTGPWPLRSWLALRRHWIMSLVGLALIVAAVAVLVYIKEHDNRAAIDSIAVLPFLNSSKDSNADYLADGMTETLINTLSDLSNLTVMSQSAVWRYKGPDIDPARVGNALKVKGVVIGRITQRGDNLSISVELVDARNGTHLWGKRYDRSVASIIDTQEEMSRELSAQLLLKLTGKDRELLAKRYTANPDAYRFYLQGLYALNKRDPEWLTKAVDFFNRSISTDPGYPLPYAGLADSYSLLGDYNAMPVDQALPKAQAAAERALALDEGLAEAHTALGHIRLSYWDWNQAEQQYRRALELKPSDVTAHQWYANLLSARGRSADALAEIRAGLNEDPLSLSANQSLGWQLYLAGQYDDAILQFRHTLEIEPDYVTAMVPLGLSMLAKGDYQDAIDQLKRAVDLSTGKPTYPVYLGELAVAYATSGNHPQAEQLLTQMKEIAKRSYVSPYYFARVCAALGSDEVYDWLNQACQARSTELIFLKVEPTFFGLHNDPRFIDILNRIGLED